jgi:elongation factor Ts
MSFSAKDVKELREATGAGMMDCKKALNECGGDKEKAIDFLRKKGLAAAAKKQSRVAAEGLIGAFVEGKKAGLVEVNCETDFVAKNDDFINFVAEVARITANKKFDSTEDLLASEFSGAGTITDRINELTLKIGEKIAFRRFNQIEVSPNEFVGSYVHTGKIGVLLKLGASTELNANSELEEFAKDICMHITASETRFIYAEDMDENFVQREAEIYAAQLKDQGKPENMIPNIVKGKINKLASEVCLLKQKFVKDPDLTVEKYLSDFNQKFGNELKIVEFVKFSLGEGIEKREDNLADEVAKMTGGN